MMKMEGYYKCHVCGGTKFSHDVQEIFEEVFDSEAGTVVAGWCHSDGSDWLCKSCNASIPKEKVMEFLAQMYDACP